MIRFLDAAGLAQPIYAVECDGVCYGPEEVAKLRSSVLLHTLYEDVARWRETGDARDLRYVFDTMDELETTHSSDEGANQFCTPAQKGCTASKEGACCGERTYAGHRFCPKHQQRYRRTGDPTLVRKRGPKGKKE
jgi:hypothetical protein